MEAATPATADGRYPVRVDVDRQDEYARLLPLVKWLLAIPHLFVLLFVFIAAAFAHLIAFFAVIITRRYPRGLFDFVVGTQRWAFRVGAYITLLTDRYPAFSLAPDDEFPARYEIEYPPEVDRWRPLVQWFLAIPYLFVTHALGAVNGAITLIAFFSILFTRQYPPGLFAMARGILRWQARAVAYLGFLVTSYPPFRFDQEP